MLTKIQLKPIFAGVFGAFFLIAGYSGCANTGGTSGTSLIESSASATSHNAGLTCVQAGCHGSSAPSFNVAGTLYTDNTGAAINPGGTVTITGLGTLTADQNGNFYSNSDTFAGNTTTITTAAGTMTTIVNLDSGGGNCQKTGCHGDVEPYVY